MGRKEYRLFLITLLGSAALAYAADNVVDGVTLPSDRRKLDFSFPGRIDSVQVKEGDPVKVDQILAKQDDAIEMAEMQRLQHEAQSSARVDYYQADQDLKRKVLARRQSAGDGFSEAEIEEAKADVVKAERQVDVANLDHAGDVSKSRQQELKVDRLSLKSPIDGFVQEIDLRGGEYAEVSRDKPAMIVVKNNPAWVEIKELKSLQVSKLQVGQTMDVRYPNQTDWMQAKIIFISPTTFAGTENQLVRLELPNPQNLTTGLSVQVKIPDGLAEKSTPAEDMAAVNR